MEIDFKKMGGLVPAIIQDAVTKIVLMLGYMNEEAYKKTIETKTTKKISKGSFIDPDSKRGKNGSSLI